MIDKIIDFSIKNKFFIGLMTLALIIGGVYSMQNIPLDATPDISNNQVQVITVAPNLGTEDIEQFVTYQVELAMSNLPKVDEIRSVSRFGLSVVTIVFDDDMGTYLPRQLVGEALGEIGDKIPAGFGEPFMAPISTGLGEVYQYVLEVAPGYEKKYDSRELRSIQEWIVKRQMAMTPGVVEVNSFGGYTKQYEIAVDPNQLRSMGVSMVELFEAVNKNNQNTGGAYIEKNHKVNYIRGEGLARSLQDIEEMVVKVINGHPVYVRDVATVQYGSAIRYGAFTRNGKGEAVGGIVMMLKGANSNKVITTIKERMEKIQKTLPEGVKIVSFLDRSEMISNTTSTVAENLALGALIVVFILVLILGNMRGGLIVASTIPLSLLFAFIMMYVFDVWANLMSLGAIDFGILIDGAVIIVECMLFYLHDKKYIGQTLMPSERDALAKRASSNMMQSAFFGQIIIMIVFIPIMVLGGIEGKMFKPMAMTFSFAVLGVLILCLTYVPMMSALFLRAPLKRKKTIGDRIVKSVENFYRPIVTWVLDHTKAVLSTAVILLIGSALLFSRMGGEFIPQLDEGNVAMHILMKPGTALTDVVNASTQVEKRLLENFPNEIKSIQTRIGVADIPTDPMPMDIGDSFIILHNKSDWKVTQDKEELVKLFKKTVSEIPGINYEFTQPLEMRFNELLTGVREDLAIKIYGEDLNILEEKAKEIEKLIAPIDGVGDYKAEATKGLPQITVHYKRNRVAQYGLNIADLNQLIETAFSGSKAGVIYEGEKSFDIVVRLKNSNRTNINDIKNLYVNLPNGKQIPLKEIAEISFKPGPMQISRDNTQRRTYVGVNVRNRDIKSLVKEIQETLDEKLELPAGYFIQYGGAFENLQRATSRLLLVVPLALGIIFLLVFIAIHSFKQTLMIYVAIPLAAVGGIVSLYLRDMPFSISAGVGFIVLFGVAVMNGLVLISGFNELKAEGHHTLRDIIIKGSIRRIRPILLTASTDILGFLPMAVSASAGAEVQRPLATVVIGGMLTATLLTLLILPVLYQLVEKMKLRKKKPKINDPKSLFAGILMLFIILPTILKAQDTITVTTPIITLEQATTLAQKNYPSIRAAALTVKMHQQMKGTAIDLGTTTISTSRDEVKGVEKGSQTLFSIGQEDIDLLGVYARKKYLSSEVKVAQATYELTIDKIILQTQLCFNELRYKKATLTIYKNIETIYRNFIKAAELRYETQETSKLALLTAQAKYNELVLKVEQLAGEQETAKQELNQYLQLDGPFTINDSLAPGVLSYNTLAANSSLSLSTQQVNRAHRFYKQEQANFLPKFNFSYKKQRVEGVGGYSGYEVGISIPLFNGQISKTKAARTQIRIEEQNKNELELLLQSQLQQRFIEYHSLQKMQYYYEEQALPLVKEEIKAYQLAYQLGEIDYISFIQGIETSLTTQLNYVTSDLKYRNTIAEIHYLTGENRK